MRRRRMRSMDIIFVVLLLGTNLAGPARGADAEVAATEETEPPRGRLELHAGWGVRNDRFAADGARINARGGAISDLALGGAWFAPGQWYGFAGRLALERFGVRDEDPARPGTLALTGFEGAAGLGARLAASARVTLEGHLGYGLVQAPQALPGATTLTPINVRAHGPMAAVSLNAVLADWLSLEATGRALPVSFGASYQGRSLALRRLAVGGAATVGRLETSGLRFAGLLRYELATTSGGATGVDLAQARHQVGVGVRATFLSPPRPQAPPPPPPPPVLGRVRGVVRAGGQATPLPDVVITAPGRAAVRTGADGAFVLTDVPAGLITLRFSKPQHVDAEEIISVPAGGESTVDVTLRRVAGPRPAAVTGLVRGENGAPVAARVRVIELGLTSEADVGGHFRFEVPPGHYTLVIEAPGFVVQRKSVEAAAGEHNIYDVDLQRAP
jgi:hypothetical protein